MTSTGMLKRTIAELERQNRLLSILVMAFDFGDDEVDPADLEAARRFWNGEDDFTVHPETVRRVTDPNGFNYEERKVFGKEVKR